MIASADQLAREHFGFARTLAWRGVTSDEEFDDVLGDALLGLARAIDTYDPSSGKTFRNWAYLKMLGAIRDGKRERDHLSRRHRRALRNREAGQHELPPISLELPLTFEWGEPVRLVEALAEPHHFLGDVIVSDLYDRLPRRERFVLAMHDEGYTLAEIGRVLGVTESRASQLRTRACQRLGVMAA